MAAAHSALWELLREDKPTEDGRSKEEVSSVAATYIPQLTTFRLDRLVKEPSLLTLEDEKLTSQMEQLAVDHYGSFIFSNQMTSSIRSKMLIASSTFTDVSASKPQLEKAVQMFQNSAEAYRKEQNTFHIVNERHFTIAEMLEIPTLVDTCIRNELYDDSLDLLGHADQVVHSFRCRNSSLATDESDNVRTENIQKFLSRFQEELDEQKRHLESNLFHVLEGDVRLPMAVRVLGFLRRLRANVGEEDSSESSLQEDFISCRNSFVVSHRLSVDNLILSDPSTGLRTGADVLRTHVCDVAMQYRALFATTSGLLAEWMVRQIKWFETRLRKTLLPVSLWNSSAWFNSETLSSDVKKSTTTRTAENKNGEEEVIRNSLREVNPFFLAPPLSTSTVSALYRQTDHASATLQRFDSSFFTLVSPIFDVYMEEVMRAAIGRALLIFSSELEVHDWIPTSEPFSLGEPATSSQPPSRSSTSLLPSQSSLTRHRPLAVFSNELFSALNDLRQCALTAIGSTVCRYFEDGLMEAADILEDVGIKIGAVDLTGSFYVASDQGEASTVKEFLRLSHAYVGILLPLIESTLANVWIGDSHSSLRSFSCSKIKTRIRWISLSESEVVGAGGSSVESYLENPTNFSEELPKNDMPYDGGAAEDANTSLPSENTNGELTVLPV